MSGTQQRKEICPPAPQLVLKPGVPAVAWEEEKPLSTCPNLVNSPTFTQSQGTELFWMKGDFSLTLWTFNFGNVSHFLLWVLVLPNIHLFLLWVSNIFQQQ